MNDELDRAVLEFVQKVRAGLTSWRQSEPLHPRRGPLSLWSPSGQYRAWEEENEDKQSESALVLVFF